MRVAILLALLAAWWILWHTDILFSRVLGTLPKTAVTVRVLVPWPTAFVWISWAVTLWLLTWIATTFGAKLKKTQ